MLLIQSVVKQIFLISGLSVTNALENSLFYPPPRITLKLKMPKSTSEDCPGSSTETEHQPSSPGSSSPGHNKRSPQMPEEPLDMNVKLYPRHPLEINSNCFPASRSHSRSEAKSSSPAQRAPSAEFYRGQSLGKPLALQAALHGQASIGNGKSRPRLASSNGLEGNWSGNMSQRDDSDEMFCDQESMLSSHLPSQGNIRKSGIEHLSRSFKEATNTWVRPTEDLQYCVKPTKNVSSKEQLWGRQLLRRSTGRAPYQEADGYCPDLQPSDSEAEGEGNTEKARVKRESSDRENPHDSAREGHGKSKTYPHSHTSMQR